MQKLIKKATDKVDTPWGLDWFVQAGHGGNGNRNCTLVEDATLRRRRIRSWQGQRPATTWADSIGAASTSKVIRRRARPTGNVDRAARHPG